MEKITYIDCFFTCFFHLIGGLNMTLETFLNNSPDLLVCIKDKAGNIIYPTSSSEINFIKELIPTSLTECLHPSTKQYFRTTKTFATEGCHTYQIVRYMDITNLKQLMHSYELDESTKIPLKKKVLADFNQYIDEAIKNQEEFAVAMADIDYFKSVNDTYGHQAGDLILHNIAQILQTSIQHDDKRTKDIIGRFGGEEFLLVLKNIPASVSLIRVELIRSKIQDMSFLYNDQDIQVTCSFGLIHVPSTYLKKINQDHLGTSSFQETLIKETDKQLYQAKEKGRNQTCMHRLTI